MNGEVLDLNGHAFNVGDVVAFLDVHETCGQCWHCLVAKASTRCPKRYLFPTPQQYTPTHDTTLNTHNTEHHTQNIHHTTQNTRHTTTHNNIAQHHTNATPHNTTQHNTRQHQRNTTPTTPHQTTPHNTTQHATQYNTSPHTTPHIQHLHNTPYRHPQQTRFDVCRKVYGITYSSEQGLLGGWSEYIYLKPGVKILRLPDSVTPEIYISGIFLLMLCPFPSIFHIKLSLFLPPSKVDADYPPPFMQSSAQR